MRLALRLVLALSPVLAALIAWRGAFLVNNLLSCQSVGKDPAPCYFGGINLQPTLSALFAWGALLWIPALVVSGLLLERTLVPLFKRPFGTRG